MISDFPGPKSEVTKTVTGVNH